MFALPSIGEVASQYVLHESRNAELLEEVDEDDIVIVTGLTQALSQKPSRIAIVSIAIALVSCSIALQSSSLLLIMGIVAVSGCLAKVAIKYRLKTFVRKMGELDVTARRANRAMLQRELVSFGLGLSTSKALSACRLHLFSNCRENIRFLILLAENLVSASFMSEEQSRLVSNFYTDEMKDLVHSDVSGDSPHITQGGMTTLLDLFVLHRSEVLRLMVLYLYRCPLPSAAILLFRVIFVYYREMDSLIQQMNAFTSTLSQRRSKQRRTRPPLDMVKVNELDEVALSLEDIINAISRKELTKDEVRTALQRILSMKIFAGAVTKKSVKEPGEEVQLTDRPNVLEARTVDDDLVSSAPLCDQVYEVIASHEGGEERDAITFEDDCTLEKSRELMDELRMALAGRATEFAARERRALAAFYGVSDAELDRLEKEQDAREASECLNNKGATGDTFYEFPENRNDSEIEAFDREKTFEEVGARMLPSDLLAALRMRSVAEETIGDIDD